MTALTALMKRLNLYFRLIRLDKPIGILLLLWPTLMALWLASNGKPDWTLVGIFTLGTVLMRSAGCAINDYADRDFDRYVKRTAERPLTSGKIAGTEAVLAALLIAASYPYFKRFFAHETLFRPNPLSQMNQITSGQPLPPAPS